MECESSAEPVQVGSSVAQCEPSQPAPSQAQAAGVGAGLSSVEVSDSLWAEFERRRREDREKRRERQTARGVKQLLLDVQRERQADSCCHTPITGGASVRSSISPRRDQDSPPSVKREKKESDIQRILTEVQLERTRAIVSSPRPRSSLQPCQEKPRGKLVRLSDKVRSSVKGIDEQMSGSDKQGGEGIAGVSSDQAVGSTNVSKQAMSDALLPTSPHSRPRGSSQRGRSPRARSMPQSHSPKPMTSPGRCQEIIYKRPTFAKQTISSGFRRVSTSPGRKEEATSQVGKKPMPKAFPAGGWDDRVSCTDALGNNLAGFRWQSATESSEMGRSKPGGRRGRPRQPWDPRTSCAVRALRRAWVPLQTA